MASPSDMPFIDCHAHIGRLPGVLGDQYSADDLCYIAEREGAALMLASSASVMMVSQAVGAAETFEMVERYPDRLGGLLWINPNDPSWLDYVEPAVKAGVCGLKIHPVLDHYQVSRAALGPVFACAREHNLPVLTHTGEDGTPTSGLCYEPLIQNYPEVELILAHQRLEPISLAKRYDNVYVDTTHVSAAMVEIQLDVLGADKILFGTDAPAGFDVGHPTVRARPRRSYAEIFNGLRDRGIPEAALEKILYQNTRSMFGIQ